MSDPRIAYMPRPDDAEEAELDVLASVYRFVLSVGPLRRSKEREVEGGPATAPDDAKESNGRVATEKYTG